MFQHGLVDKAVEEADAMKDDQIGGSDKFFDDHNAPYQTVSDHEEFERAVYRYEGFWKYRQ